MTDPVEEEIAVPGDLFKLLSDFGDLEADDVVEYVGDDEGDGSKLYIEYHPNGDGPDAPEPFPVDESELKPYKLSRDQRKALSILKHVMLGEDCVAGSRGCHYIKLAATQLERAISEGIANYKIKKRRVAKRAAELQSEIDERQRELYDLIGVQNDPVEPTV